MIPIEFNSTADVCLLQALIHVFYGACARGNTARCFIFAGPPSARWKRENIHAGGETWCLLWRQDDVVRVVALRHGNEIHFCGHGLVAAGYFWFINYQEAPVLAAAGGYYATRCDYPAHCDYQTRCASQEHHFAIAAPQLAPRYLCADEFSKKNWFDSAPNACFYIGGSNDYFLCTWGRGVNIANIKINLDLIAMQPRAVIMTQCDVASVRSQRDIPFDLRYLAPQYGEDEGSATGSAAAIAANYWRLHFQALPGQRLLAKQRSPTGGEIYCTVDRNAIWIGGRVEMEADA